MKKNQFHLHKTHGALVLALLVTISLLTIACGISPAVSGAVSNIVGSAATAAPGTPATAAAPQAQNASSGLDCSAIAKANMEFGTNLAQMVNFTANTDYSAYTDPSSPLYMDFSIIRADLTAFSALPDPTDPAELLFGKPSESVAYFRQLVDIAEADVKSQGKPFVDTNSSGVKVFGLSSPWMKEMSAFGPAIDKACKNATIPTDAPASDLPTNTVGQTATMGDLRVTLEKVVAVPGVLGNLPDAGLRFVFISVTIENTGKATLQTNLVSTSTFKDTAGKVYYFNANAIMLDASKPINGEVASGEKTSGTIGFALPVKAGDLVWIVEDNAQHRAVFTVKTTDITQVGTPIDDSTAAGMKTSVAATTEAIITLGSSMDATAAAMTANPGTPEPTETPQPTDTPEPTETPGS